MTPGTLSDRAVVEVFHLSFLRTLLAGTNEKAHIVLKGGCNLRFFFRSPRYSEDIDLDVDTIARHTLHKNVESALSGQLLARQLAVFAIEVADSSAPKQTDTTQRWKVQLQTGARATLPTKIEFSRRPAADEAELASVDRELLAAYRLPPVQAKHYPPAAALRQKVVALARRDVPQARDVFDVDLLLTRVGGQIPTFDDVVPEVRAARDRALTITFDEYVGQVVAYLEPEQQPLWRSRETWEAMQLHVAEALDGVVS